MEILAYIHLAEAHEASQAVEPVTVSTTTRLNILTPGFASRTWIRLVSLAVVSTIVGIASQARAELSLGSRGPEVRTIQGQLQKLGYFKRLPTGKFGPLTKAAVIRFQTDTGLTPNGIVDDSTESALQQHSTGSNSAPSTPASQRPKLRIGDRGADVKSLQQILTDVEAYSGKINGQFDDSTLDAVKQFQKDNGLAVDGIVGPRTWSVLSSFAAGGNTPVAQGPFNGSSFTNSPTLQFGDSGPSVQSIQQRLRDLGYLNGRPTGNFDQATRDAVIRFQEAASLPADGIVNATTQEAIGGMSTSVKKYSVSQLQRRLRDKGFYQGPIDGKLGRQTKAAIKAAQKHYGVSEEDILKAQF